jgi:hypothetical protein
MSPSIASLIASLNPDFYPRDHKVLDPEHPEQAAIRVKMGATHHQTGAWRLSYLFLKFLQESGYSNISLNGVNVTNLEVMLVDGMTSPELEALWKRVHIDIDVALPCTVK